MKPTYKTAPASRVRVVRAGARRFACALVAAVTFVPEAVQAWTIGSQLDYDGCHELISAEALRATRGSYATAPRITPSRDEAALIDEVQFIPPSDFVDDLAGMTLLLGVRDNDLKGAQSARLPRKFDRVNLRSSVHLGVSTLLFDVNGAPKYSVGPFGAFTPLGIDYDLGNAVRLVIDPVEIAVPVPHIGLIPLYYEQFRLMSGLQIGA